MHQPIERSNQNRRKSSIWIISVAVFLVIFLILQQEQDGQPESPASSSSVSVPTDRNDQSTQHDPGPLSRSEEALENQQPGTSASAQKQPPGKQSVLTPASANRPPPGGSVKSATKLRPELGQLQKSGRQIWESTAGLKYGPGSQEKHRLKHVMRHATDQPRRPGKHGVFAGGGDQDKVLALIDEAYLKALQGGKAVQKKREGQRTVYTVDMQRPVGYVGGQIGNRLGKPPANKIRLVLEGPNVITAFPM